MTRSRQGSDPQSPRYIRLADAIRLMKGLVSRTEFYARYRWGPDIVRRLDIRGDAGRTRSLTCNQEAVLRWLEALRKARPLSWAPDRNAENLGARARRSSESTPPFGEALAALCGALAEGHISEEEFLEAKRDLKPEPR